MDFLTEMQKKMACFGDQGCVSLRFKELPEGHRFPYLKNSKIEKKINKMFTSRWPGAKSASVHQLAKMLYLGLSGHFKDTKPLYILLIVNCRCESVV